MPDGKQSKKLTSTPGEWFVIIQTSRILDNNLLVELTDEDLQNMQYHDRTCYPVTSVLVKDKNQLKYETKQNTKSSIVSELSSVESKHKRPKTHTESDAKKNPCIIYYEWTVNVQTNVFELKILNLQFPKCL